MIKNFDELIASVKSLPKKRVVVVAAAEKQVIEVMKAVDTSGIADFLLLGDRNEISSLAKMTGLNLKPEHIVDIESKSEIKMAEKAVSMIEENKADLIMKGHIPTAVFLKPILNKNSCLRGNGLLNQVSVFEKNSGDGLRIMGDCAINISPNLEQKRQIIKNALKLAWRIGYDVPRVAMLAAVETVNPNMPETLDAAVLSKMWERGQMADCQIDGPLSLDSAISIESAHRKGLNNGVAGKADILIVPDIRMGNGLHKSLVYFAVKKVAGLVLGAKMPIIMSSRSDTIESQHISIALAAYLSREDG